MENAMQSTFAKQLEEHGATVSHIGILVRDLKKAVEFLNMLPYVRGWTDICEPAFTSEKLIVGKPAVIRYTCAGLADFSLELEVIQPVMDQCEKGAYFSEYLQNHDEGFHHIAYNIPEYSDFLKLMDQFTVLGCSIVHHGRDIIQDQNSNNKLIEFAYIAPMEYGNCITEIKCLNVPFEIGLPGSEAVQEESVKENHFQLH